MSHAYGIIMEQHVEWTMDLCLLYSSYTMYYHAE